MKNLLLLFAVILFFAACKKETVAPPPDAPMYFPPVGTSAWETITPASLGWKETLIPELYNFLQTKGTRAFVVVQNGRIVLEKYFGSFTADSNWYWASAGKTATAMLVGIAQQEGHLNISNRTSQYLGNGWTSLPLAKEALITVRHQLTMTTGLDDGVANSDCTTPACLTYATDAGTRWAYHNAPYTLLADVVANATGTSFQNYFQQKIRNPIGMNGLWIQSADNNVYWSTPRSMARFGLLLLNKGSWNGTSILADTAFLRAQTNTSQSLNPSYGYLTWLNGKSGYMLPQTQVSFNGALVPNAPADMFAALGKNDQKIYVVPSRKLVVIRMGDSAGNPQLAASSFDNELWGKLKTLME